jgi:hypothetical protein
MNEFDPADLLTKSAPRLSAAANARHLELLRAEMASPTIDAQQRPTGDHEPHERTTGTPSNTSARPAALGAPTDQVRTARHRRRSLTGASVASAALLALGAGAAVAWVDREEPSITDIARCFAISDPAQASEWTQEGGDFFHDTGYITGEAANGTVANTAQHAIESCAASWRAGGLSTTPPYTRALDPWYVDYQGPKPAEHPVPDLVACVLPTGSVGVFPDTTCAALRLPEADL